MATRILAPISHRISSAVGMALAPSQRRYRTRLKEIADMHLVFLGTSSSEPTRTRNVSGVALKFAGKSWLIDCGEGIQRQIGNVNSLTTCSIEKIFVTHMHGDHVFGLPGLLCNIVHNSPNGHPPVGIYGPPGLRRYLHEALRMTTAAVPEYFVRELHSSRSTMDHKDDLMCELPQSSKPRWKLHEDGVCTVYAGAITHRVDCWGYIFEEKTAHTLDPEKAEVLGVRRGTLLARLKEGQTVHGTRGKKVTMRDVTFATRLGRKIVVLGDTCDPTGVADLAKGCDVLVHESTYDETLRPIAIERGHSTPGMAGDFASMVGADKLVLTHFSARYRNEMAIQSMISAAQGAFGSTNVVAAEDFLEVPIPRRASNPV